jgi:hypothetical protein
VLQSGGGGYQDCGGCVWALWRGRAIERIGVLTSIPNILPSLELRKPNAVAGEITVGDNEQFFTNQWRKFVAILRCHGDLHDELYGALEERAAGNIAAQKN